MDEFRENVLDLVAERVDIDESDVREDETGVYIAGDTGEVKFSESPQKPGWNIEFSAYKEYDDETADVISDLVTF